MREIIEKIKEHVNVVEQEKGNFNLFVMFKEKDGLDKWDIYVDADWFYKNDKDTLNYIVKNIIYKLPKNEIVKISKIILTKKINNQIVNDLINNYEYLKSDLEQLIIISFHPEKFNLNKLRNVV